GTLAVLAVRIVDLATNRGEQLLARHFGETTERRRTHRVVGVGQRQDTQALLNNGLVESREQRGRSCANPSGRVEQGSQQNVRAVVGGRDPRQPVLSGVNEIRLVLS